MTREEMLKTIKAADRAYYEADSPIMEDSQYDVLRNKYIELYGSADLDYVPGEPSNTFKKFNHPYPVTSLAKVRAKDKDILDKIHKIEPVVVELKFDGLTVVSYPDGKFVTRGNGHIGEILPNFISGIVNNTGHIIRGEVVMLKSVFEDANKDLVAQNKEPYKNPRNAAAGILRNIQKNKYLDRLTYVIYDVMDMPDAPYYDKRTILIEMRNSNRSVEYCCGIKINNIMVEDLNEIYKQNIESDYPIDGLVLKNIEENSYTKFGYTAHHPNNQLAFKVTTDTAETKLLDVVWQVGRTADSLTPVGIIEPVDLYGTTVSRVTLHNEDFVKEMGLKINAIIEITKANEIIPQVLSVVRDGDTEIVKPDSSNIDNKELLIKNVMYLASKKVLDINGLSEATVTKLAEKGYIKSLYDIFTVSVDDILSLEGFANTSATKLYNAIQASTKDVTLDKFIRALCVVDIGRDISNKLCSVYNTPEQIEEDIKSLAIKDKLSNMKGIGIKTVDKVLSDEFKDRLSQLRTYIKPLFNSIEEKPKSSNLTFVFTGKLQHPRAHYESIVMSKGHNVLDSINKKVDYLVAGDKAGSKLAKADKLGIKVITEEELNALL